MSRQGAWPTVGLAGAARRHGAGDAVRGVYRAARRGGGDSDPEARIREAPRRLMTAGTEFVIAHRLSTVRDVDVIYVMDGRVVVDARSHLAIGGRDGL